jgi:hypothetical protein
MSVQGDAAPGIIAGSLPLTESARIETTGSENWGRCRMR